LTLLLLIVVAFGVVPPFLGIDAPVDDDVSEWMEMSETGDDWSWLVALAAAATTATEVELSIGCPLEIALTTLNEW